MERHIKTPHIVAFGDIHGCPKAAAKAISLAKKNCWKAVFLGDYVDRGERSVEVLQLILKAKQEHADWEFLVGNHDKMLLDLMCGKRHAEGYDERTAKESFRELQVLSVSEQNTMRHLLQSLKLYHESESFLFLHGGFTSSSPSLSSVSTDEIVWTYGIPNDYRGKKVIRGHDPVKCPIHSENNININTECGYGGSLTGAVLNDELGKIVKCFKISENGKMLGDW